MMGIYINGMGIPTAGLYIVSVDNTNGRDKIVATIERMLCIRDIRQIVGTFELVHVPSHGRLIDADEISEHKYATIPSYRKEYCDGKPKSEDEIIAFKFGWNNAIDAITENAPTIIEAAEGE